MRRFLISIIIFATVLPVIAQEEEKKFSIDVYGFVRNDFYYESRRSMTAAAGLFHLIPLDQNLNVLNEDLNAIPSSKMLSTASRFGLKVKGPDVWGAAASARIEGDFDGFTSGHTGNTVFRIRQAWTKLSWEKVDLLAGQAWHPMFGDVFPSVLSLATGSPFQPFNRSPQIRVDYKMKDFKAYLSGLYQLQYLSPGPSGSSPDYLKDGMLPELYLGFEYKKNELIAGVGADFIRLRPRVITGTTINDRKVSDNISSISFNAFVQYTKDKLAVKAKTIYGQNMGHLLLLSGYGISKVNDDRSYEYTNLNNSTSWLNVTYGKKYQAGLFLGYSKNLGSSSQFEVSPDIPSYTFTFGASNIDQVYRISPQVSYNLKHWQFGIEYEMTTVSYGTMDSKGKVKDTHDVTNNRVAGVMVYNF
jgi:hypothetical protein